MNMKKTYINPTMEVVKLQMHQQMLTGSDPKLNGEYEGGTVLGRDFDFEDEDEY